MVLIDMEMPKACCECPINFWNRCALLAPIGRGGGNIEHPSDGRLPNCPLLTTSDLIRALNKVEGRTTNETI